MNQPVSVVINQTLGPEARNYYGINMDIKRSQYRKHNLYVKTHCPPERLLIYKLGDGWEPLCKFLGKPVPEVTALIWLLFDQKTSAYVNNLERIPAL